jgi:YD repeat-containing protein
LHAQCNPFRNANSSVTGTVDPLNGTTAYAFDAADRQIAVRAPLGLITTTVYDPDSLVSATIDALNARTTFGYDPASRRVSVTDPLGAITTTVYYPDDLMQNAVDALGKSTNFIYEASYREIGQDDELNNSLQTAYDTDSRSIILHLSSEVGIYTYPRLVKQTASIGSGQRNMIYHTSCRIRVKLRHWFEINRGRFAAKWGPSDPPGDRLGVLQQCYRNPWNDPALPLSCCDR